ncbi:S8 family peptidase [Bacillus fonticola]|uniref:S8 family peptidase n=1 Tax=Bacillus fonticola TaxID=2728853 RepID=UPI001475878D|nr:S8 family serine peptidase [Bacillus fonticola]
MQYKKLLSLGLVAGLVVSTLAPSSLLAKEKVDANPASVTSLTDIKEQWKQKTDQNSVDALSKDTIVVKTSQPLTALQHQKAGGTVIKNIGSHIIIKVQNGEEGLHNAINTYSTYDGVQSVQPSVQFQLFSTVTDPKASEQYYLSMLKIPEALQLAGEKRVKVAVVDQGVDAEHPDLDGQMLPGYNTVNPMRQPIADFHGTHVAGIIGAEKGNGVGGYGVNPNVDILPIDVFNRGLGATDYAIAEGIRKAVDEGAQVINMSLGGPFPSTVIEEAVEYALQKNVVIVAAAGNNGSDDKNYPAAYEGVISVGAVNNKKELADFSSYGSSVDVVAPGEAIYSPFYDYEKGSTFEFLSGTSMASPVVAGVASLLLSKYPELTPTQVEYVLEKTAEDLGNKGFDSTFGNGLVNPVAALQFDVSQAPKGTPSNIPTGDVMDLAAEVVLSEGKATVEGSFVNAYEQKWYAVPLKKGELLQLNLSSADEFDHGIDFRFLGGATHDVTDVNKVTEGGEEGLLYEAPRDGNAYIGIRDVNGSFDDSDARANSFELSFSRVSQQPTDGSSDQQLAVFEEIPGSIEDTFYSADTETEVDDDYYQITSDKDQVIKVDLSGVPGVDGNIEVYNGEEYAQYLEMLEEVPVEEEAPFPGTGEIYTPYPIAQTNSAGAGEDESLTFEAGAGESFVVKVSNEATYFFGPVDFFLNPGMDLSEGVAQSITPYTLSAEGKVLPEDEDGLPVLEFPEEMKGTEETEMAVKKAKISALTEEEFTIQNPEEQRIEQIRQNALRHYNGDTTTGYLQARFDEDWYRYEAPEDGIYSFELTEGIANLDIVTIDKYEDENGVTRETIMYVASGGYDYYGEDTDVEVFANLEKGKEYYVMVTPSYMMDALSFDPYSFRSRTVSTNIQDEYEPNDKLEKVQDIPGNTFEGNFAKMYDVDTFYYQSKKDQVLGVELAQKELSESLQRQLPKEIQGDFLGIATLFEDRNNNRKVDEDEFSTAQTVMPDLLSMTLPTTQYGGFQVEKGKNFVLVLEGMSLESSITVKPYRFTLSELSQDDEDANSVVTNNRSSAPLPLKKQSSRLWTVEGNLNTGVDYGDEDWYELNVAQDALYKLRLNTSAEVDAVIEVYQNGELVLSGDDYGKGDDEIHYVSLTKGTYQIKVRDVFRGAAVDPYELKAYIEQYE